MNKFPLTLGLIVLFFKGYSQDSTLKYPYHFKSEGNPIIRHIRVADPSAHVWKDGKLWLYASHDMDNATDYYSMDGYHVFSTEDMLNWIDWGEVLHSRDIKWGKAGTMWAPDCAYKNGKYYLYFPHKDNEGKWRTGVAVSDKPQGPFKAMPNYIEGTSGIDPTCFIDQDGQAYLYFNTNLVARLKDNMTELAEPARKISYDGQESPGLEGTYMHKRNVLFMVQSQN
jgi:arabinoxylan arabinofuranohydrolase